jgi:outer membrane protein
VKKNAMMFIGLLMLLTSLVALAQTKVGYIDSQRILAGLPEYKDIQAKLQEESAVWQKEYEGKVKEYQDKRQNYENQKLLLSEDKKKEREKELGEMELKIQSYQQEKFGPQGEIYKRNAELSKPLIDRIQKIIDKVAIKEGYDLVLDATAGNILYADDRINLTDLVVAELGKGSGGGKKPEVKKPEKKEEKPIEKK